MYLESKFGAHSQREEKARELADKIISEMPQLDIKKPGKMECERFDMGLVFGNHTSWERMVIDPEGFCPAARSGEPGILHGYVKTRFPQSRRGSVCPG